MLCLSKGIILGVCALTVLNIRPFIIPIGLITSYAVPLFIWL